MINKKARLKRKGFIEGIDRDYRLLKLPAVLQVGCCDCGLMHQWFFEKVGKNKIRLGTIRDDYATRKFKKLNKYERQEKKIKKKS